MNKSFSIINQGKQKKVSGIQAGKYFFIYSEPSVGWKIVHELSGCLLTRACFVNAKNAEAFALLVEDVFKDLLDYPAPDVLFRSRFEVERGLEIWSLTYELEGISHLVSMRDVEKVINGRDTATVFDGAEQGAFVGGFGAFEAGEPV